MKKSKHIQVDDMETINYNSNIEQDDLSTINYNSDVEIDDVSDAETIDYNTTTNKNDVAQQEAKRIIKKYRNSKRKAAIQNIIPKKIKIPNNNDDDVAFVKQVPVHPRNMLARATKDGVVFLKQVPVHPRDRLKRKTKNGLKHRRDRLKEKELQIARDNVTALMEGKFNFSPEKILNKTILFDVSIINEERIIDKTIENLPADNDELYIAHESGSNSFSLKREGGK